MESEEYISAEESFGSPSCNSSDSAAASNTMNDQSKSQVFVSAGAMAKEGSAEESEDVPVIVKDVVVQELLPKTRAESSGSSEEYVERGRHGCPLSRNTYTFTCVLPQSSIIRVTVLSKWDNIMGPRPVHVWKQQTTDNEEQGKTSNSVQYIVGHTLVAEELNKLSTHPSRVVAAWFHVPQESMLYAAATFQVMEDGLKIPHCLSVAFEKGKMETIVHWKQLIMDWLTGAATKIRLFLVKENNMDLVEKTGKAEVVKVHELVESLLNYSVVRRPLDHCVGLLADKSLSEKAITSHLQTGCCSLVIASSQQQADEMINFLSYLVPKDKLCHSRFVVPHLPDQFQPGLVLQGLVLSQAAVLKDKELLGSPFPLTVIDLRTGLVKQGLPVPLHQRARTNYQMQMLKSFVSPNNDTSTSSVSCLHIVKEGSPIVHSFLKDLLKLPPAEWSAFFLLFFRQLHYKSLSFLSFVQDKLEKYRTERGSAWKRSLEKSSKGFLGVEQADFLIILSIAEHLQPGIIQLLAPSMSPTSM